MTLFLKVDRGAALPVSSQDHRPQGQRGRDTDTENESFKGVDEGLHTSMHHFT